MDKILRLKKKTLCLQYNKFTVVKKSNLENFPSNNPKNMICFVSEFDLLVTGTPVLNRLHDCLSYSRAYLKPAHAIFGSILKLPDLI